MTLQTNEVKKIMPKYRYHFSACIIVLKNSERDRGKSGRRTVVVRNTNAEKENVFEFSKGKYQSFLNGREKILPI